ncbi:MAG: hypothetical protein RL456_2340 [Pseudomonadota bacterium]|jgi:hypothetical protein
MLGSLISTVIKTATLPIDMAESVMDVATGGDGSKESKQRSGVPRPSELRDAVCQAAEDLDD